MDSETAVSTTHPNRFNGRAWSVALYLFWAAWMTFLAVTWTRHPGLDHGDAFTDACVLIGGRNYDRIGFGAHAGLPVLDTYITPDHPPEIYSHYPPLPWWFHQLLKEIGVASLAAQRLVAAIITAFAALIMFRVMCRLAECRMAGAMAALFYMASVPFTAYSDSVYQFAYGQLSLFATLALWLAAERASSASRRRVLFGLAALAFFVDGWITFEHIAVILAFVIGRTLLRRDRRPVIGCAVMVCVPLVLMAARLVHNAVALGGFDAAIADLSTAAERRGGHEAVGLTYFDLLRVWVGRIGGRGLSPTSPDAQSGLPLLTLGVWVPCMVLGAMLVWARLRKRPYVRTAGLADALFLLLGGTAWLIALKQHAFVHRHLIMNLLPGTSLLLGVLAASGVRPALHSDAGALRRIVGAMAAGVLVIAYVLPLRASRAMNQFVVLDKNVRRMVLADRAYYQCVRRGRPALADVQHLLIFGLYPQIAWELDIPFENVEEVPETLGEHDALWIAALTPRERDAAGEALTRFGLPDVFDLAAAGRFVFRGGRHGKYGCDVRLEADWRMRNVRFTETLDRRAWALQVVFDNPRAPAPADDLYAFCHVVDALNTGLLKVNAPLASAIGKDGERLVSHVLPKSQVPADSRLVFGLLSSRTTRPLRIVGPPRGLPAGASASPGADYISWTPRELWPNDAAASSGASLHGPD